MYVELTQFLHGIRHAIPNKVCGFHESIDYYPDIIMFEKSWGHSDDEVHSDVIPFPLRDGQGL